MAAIFTARLGEFGSFYQVNNVVLTEAKYILPNGKYVDLPTEVAIKLKNELNQGKIITIEKNNVDDRHSTDIPLEHFKIEEPKTLDQLKAKAKSKVGQRVSAYTAMLTGFDIMEFWLITGKLKSSGFDIMNEQNKEEIYLSIINTGNEDLISDLERFLEVKDIFDNMMRKYRGLKQYFREVNDCDTEEELEDVIKNNQGWLVN